MDLLHRGSPVLFFGIDECGISRGSLSHTCRPPAESSWKYRSSVLANRKTSMSHRCDNWQRRLLMFRRDRDCPVRLVRSYHVVRRLRKPFLPLPESSSSPSLLPNLRGQED